MKRRIYNFGIRNSLAMTFCLVLLIALVASDLSVSSSSGGKRAANTDVRIASPTVTSLCFSGQTLGSPDPTNVRLGTAVLVDSTTCNAASSGCTTTAGTFFLDVYAINVTGCQAGQNPNITAQTCTSSCGAAGTADTVIGIYQKASGAPGVNGDPVFDPPNPCTNLRAGDNNGCSPQSTQTVTLCPGVFVVVVTHNVTAVGGTYNLLVTINSGTGCSEASIPTLAKLDAFAANGYVDGTNISWKTGREVDNLGFNIYREEGGKRSRINDQVLAGSALLAGPGTDLRSGNSYAWTDTSPAGKKTRYWLEDLGLDGQSTWHGPFNVNRSAPGDRLPRSNGRAQLLSKLGASAQAGQTVPLPRAANSSPMMIDGQFSAQSDMAMRPAMKLSVKQEGWYRVSQPDLAAAGLDTRTDPRMLEMFVDGQEQAISVSGEEDGHFDSSDAVEFYGLGVDSAVTDSRTYWLVSGSQPGLRIEKVKGKGSRAAPASFPYTVERRDRSIYFSALRNGDKENFFGAVIASHAVDQSISVQHLDTESGAELELALQGVTEISHRIRVELNAVEVGAVGFDAQTEGITKIPLGRGVLKEGQNIVRLTALGGESDVSLVDYIRVIYPHTYTADSDALGFPAPARQQVSIDGFTSSAIRVIDVTDPGAVREVTARVEARKGSYSVIVSAPKGVGDRLLLAFSDSTARAPAAMTLNRPSNLREPALGADLVIITHRDFLDSVAPLKALRESQGLSVAVVDVEDIYDEFNFGQKSPQALKDFLAFARSSWQTPPRYVLLVGDASLDPKGYLGFGDSDLVPTRLIDTTLMETASDDWFADFDGDGIADLAIGRLPVRTSDEAATMVAKILGYDRTDPVNRVLLVSDSDDGFNFESASHALRITIPRNTEVSEIDRGQMEPAEASSLLLARIHQGQKIVNYVGHGSVDQWRSNVLNSALAKDLENSAHLPLFISMTCLNGYFQDAALESLAESLMKARRGGAIAVWASSGMTAPPAQSVMNQQMFKLVLDNAAASLTLGEATIRAKSAVNDGDVRRTWILFGDPTMKLR